VICETILLPQVADDAGTLRRELLEATERRATPEAEAPRRLRAMPGGAKASTIPIERLAMYDRAVATLPDVARKGATVPYTSVNGHMFSFLTPTGSLALRLPAGEREAFLVRFATSLHKAQGTVMKEYVAVPDGLLADTAALAPYLATSYAYVSSLKPKPTTRKSSTR